MLNEQTKHQIIELKNKGTKFVNIAKKLNLGINSVYGFNEKEYRKNYRIKNKDKAKQYIMGWLQKNKEKRKKLRHDQYIKSKEKIKQRILSNPTFYKEKRRLFNLKHKDKIAKYDNEYKKRRKKNDPKFKIATQLRHRLRRALEEQNTRKTFKTNKIENLIGCSIEYLKQQLETNFQPGMNWSNNTNSGWHVDHIIPCVNFDLTIEIERKKCFHYTNLQPLWAPDNLSKGTKIIKNNV